MNMKLVRTVELKLNIPVESIKPTLDAYTKAFNFVCQVRWNDSDSNGVSLHNVKLSGGDADAPDSRRG